MNAIKLLTLSAVCGPLLTGSITGFFVRSHRLAHRLCIAGMLLSFVCVLGLCKVFFLDLAQDQSPLVINLFQWSQLPNMNAMIGFTLDGLSLAMLLMISSVATLIHVYSIGYMRDEIGYVRFFSLISLFSFAMLFLVATNNLVSLFFGWESISLFSYFLIGYYYHKDSAAKANYKAFLINRLGDCAFCLGIVLLINNCGGTSYTNVYASLQNLVASDMLVMGVPIKVSTLAGTLFFIAAMAKSAQIPLHIWLPDSMEGPTPVSALLHAATMVTAGVYLLARFNVLIEPSLTLKAVISVIGASGALFLGLMALCENDIKRIIAYSTLSQLGYMMIAIGLGIYHIAIYHLIMHAFFKACLFMAAGSVIVALHHEQNIFNMGKLWSAMPVTGLCFFICALSLSGMPPFSGFYSKDLILSAAKINLASGYAGYYIYFTALIGCLVTPLYIFRLYWTVFFGQANYHQTEVFEAPVSIRLPMVILAILSVIAGSASLGLVVGPNAISLVPNMTNITTNINKGILKIVEKGLVQHAIIEPVFIFSLIGILLSWQLFKRPAPWFARIQPWLSVPQTILRNQYGLEWIYQNIIVSGCFRFAQFCQTWGEQFLINRTVESRISGNLVRGAEKASRVQTSYLNRYVAMMTIALACLIGISLFLMGIL